MISADAEGENLEGSITLRMTMFKQLLNKVGPDRRSGRSINLCDVVRLPSGLYPWALIAIFLSVSISWGREEPVNYWAIEDAEARKQLPEYKVIPAATVDELTPSNRLPFREDYRDWPRSHGDAYSSRYSGLTEITRDNVHELEVAWIYRSGDAPGNIQVNPVIVDGIMYVPTSGRNVVAVDASNGQEIWRFNPNGPPSKRGIAYWHHPEGKGDRILFAAGNRLIALLAETGKLDPSFGKKGIIKIPDTCSVPVVVFKHVVIFSGFNRHVYGYDMNTGEQLWVFHTVPEEGEFGSETWDNPEPGASANAWGGISLDEERGIVYVPTASPKPNFMGNLNLGRNLFANCILALDALTGKRLWHFQELRHDIWDEDIPAPPLLTTITHQGKRIDVVAQVTKLGNTLLLDRVSGKPIFPFRLRRAPTSTMPGVGTWPYQPDLELPEPFSRQEFTLDDVTDISEERRQYVLDMFERDGATMGWMRPNSLGRPNIICNLQGGAEWTGASVDPETGTMFVNSNEFPWYITLNLPEEDFVDETKLEPTPGRTTYATFCMACHGPNREGTGEYSALISLNRRMNDDQLKELLKTGLNLMPPAPYLQGQQLDELVDYLMDRDRSEVAKADSEKPNRPRYHFQNNGGWQRLFDQYGYHGSKPPWGKLNAIDLNTGKLKWQIPFGEYEELTAQGIPITGTENFGGSSVTAGGVVFCSGSYDLKIKAFDVENGKELWAHKLPFCGTAPPSIYEAKGKQYVVIPATGGGKLRLPPGDAYVAFALP